jgi:hypothetical protein
MIILDRNGTLLHHHPSSHTSGRTPGAQPHEPQRTTLLDRFLETLALSQSRELHGYAAPLLMVSVFMH